MSTGVSLCACGDSWVYVFSQAGHTRCRHGAVQARPLGPRGPVLDVVPTGWMSGVSGRGPWLPRADIQDWQSSGCLQGRSPQARRLLVLGIPWGWVHHSRAAERGQADPRGHKGLGQLQCGSKARPWGLPRGPSSPGTWAWLLPPAGSVVDVAETLALSQGPAALCFGSSAPTSCVCAFPRGAYIRHKLFPRLMFDFLCGINDTGRARAVDPLSPAFLKGLPQQGLVWWPG